MRRDRHCKMKGAAFAAAVALLFCSVRTFAIESVALPLEVIREDVVSLELPTIDEDETSVFDFILDPQKLLYATGAARLGGGTVEEEATLFFQNKEGQYDFSKYSDQLTVTNRSTVPVRLTISAYITDLGELKVVGSDDFTDSEDCSIYMAVVDNQGNVLPLSAEGEVSITLEMRAVPENAYVYRFSEDLQTYQLEVDLGEIDFDRYSFGLTGACNPNADWRNVSVHPMVTVTWRVEPMVAEQEGLPAEKRSIVQNEDVLEDGDIKGDTPIIDEDEQQSGEDGNTTEDDPTVDNDGQQSGEGGDVTEDDPDITGEGQQSEEDGNISGDVEAEGTVSGN